MFCGLRKHEGGPNGDGFVSLSDIKSSDLDAIAHLLTDGKLDAKQLQWQPGYGFLEKLVPWVQQPFVDADFQQSFLEVKAKIKDRIGQRLANEVLRERFAIRSYGERGETRYGLNLAADRILFE